MASVGALDCDALSTVVTLDNSRMPASTVYTVHSGEPLQLVERAVEVPPGEIAAISVSLVPNAFNEVRVNLSRRVVIAAASGVCGTWVDGPRASIGPLECGRDAAVTLDNSRSSARSAFLIQRTVAGDDHSDDARLVLGAGEVRVVPVTLEEGTITDVLVRARDEHGAVLASVEGPLCGLLTVGPVDCDTETFEVTLVNDDADHEYSREFFVSSTEFRMHRTAYHQEVRLAVGERRVLTVPVAGLLGGDLRLEEPGTMDGAVLYEEPVEVDCPAGADFSESPPASGSLAATGAGGLGRLVLAVSPSSRSVVRSSSSPQVRAGTFTFAPERKWREPEGSGIGPGKVTSQWVASPAVRRARRGCPRRPWGG